MKYLVVLLFELKRGNELYDKIFIQITILQLIMMYVKHH